jgi:small-conductance mechanosensitive channel
MNESLSTIELLMAGFQNLASQALLYLPKIIAAVVVLLLGWLLARLLSLLVVRGIGRIERFWRKLITKPGQPEVVPRQPPTRMMGELVFWLLMLIFVTLAGEILGVQIFSTWMHDVFAYLPLAAAGLLIVLVGFAVSSLARDLVLSAANSAELENGELLARTTQIIILFIAVILGIDQIGIDVLFLSVLAGIILSTMLGGIALAFGLGARTHVSNIIAVNQLRQLYQAGDRIRIGDVEGRLLDITISRVVIETEAGSVSVPAKLFDEQVVTIIEKGS